MQHTPWKKSRSYGDNYGGAKGHREEDNIHTRLHSFHAPSPFDDLPIIRVDNPSRDWFHPLDAQQVRYALKAFPMVMVMMSRMFGCAASRTHGMVQERAYGGAA